MPESEFHDLIDQIYVQIEDLIDESGADLDYETSGGVMTITCENDGSKIILSRQPATSELWIAAKSGGFHFKQDQGGWICATGESLEALLQRVIREQSQEDIEFSLN